MTIALLVFLFTGSSSATTWHVELDGSGDFTTIQPAVDAAAPGDTVLIGPGEFTDAPVNDNGHLAFATIQTPGLTIIGSGSTTIIGPTEQGYPNTFVWGIVPRSGVSSGTRLEKLRFRNLYTSVEAYDHTVVDSCSFFDCRTCIAILGSDGSAIRRCLFEHNDWISVYIAGSSGVTVEDCVSTNCGRMYLDGATDLVVRHCSFHSGWGWGRVFMSGGSGLFEDCSLVDGCMDFQNGCVAEVNRCEIVPLPIFSSGSGTCVLARSGAMVTGSNNILHGAGYATIEIQQTAEVDFKNSHILNGGAYSVYTVYEGELRTIDLSGNYWGTDSPDSLDAWIFDHNDASSSWPYVYNDCVVIYEPFSTTPLPTQQQTQGGLRRMFR